MRGKKEKDKNILPKKLGRPIKEVVPPNTNPPRENILIKQPETFNREFVLKIEPNEIFPEWPSETEINNFDFGIDKDTKFTDNFNFKLPFSMIEESKNDLKWLRPEVFIKERNLTEKIKKNYPGKNVAKIKNQIKISYMKTKKENLLLEIIPENEDKEIKEKSEEELMEEAKMRSFKPFFQILSNQPEIKIIESFEREESPEEMKKRIEIEIEKHKNENKKNLTKSPTKNDKKKIQIEEITDFPLKITVPRPSNIFMGERYCNYSKWISSVLQSIKDLSLIDCNTQQLLFQKIYPQKAGIPIFNPSGRYWIKLNFMGKYRKVEIDDLMPCGKNDEVLLPRCLNIEELWPLLITKGLIKLFNYKFASTEISMYDEVNDTSIINSLTGMVGESIEDLDDCSELIKSILNEEFYLNRQKFLLAYTNKSGENCVKRNERVKSPTSKATYFYDKVKAIKPKKNIEKNSNLIIPRFSIDGEAKNQPVPIPVNTSNFIKFERKIERTKTITYKNSGNDLNRTKTNYEQTQDTLKKLGMSPNKEKSIKKSSSNIINTDNNEEVKKNELNKNVYSNFVYPIIDYFNNHDFNMKRIKHIDFSDLNNEILAKKVSYKQLTKDEKKKYVSDIKELKERQKLEKARRIEELKIPGKKVQLIKLKSECVSKKHMDFYLDYNEDEIEMAKKCVYNNWDFPPPAFFDIAEEKSNLLDKSEKSIDQVRRTLKLTPEYSKMNNKIYSQLVKNTDIFLSEKTEIKRPSGQWMDHEEFVTTFQKFLVIHSPSFYKSSKFVDNNWSNNITDLYEANRENFVFSLIPQISFEDKIYWNNKFNKSNSCLLIVFEPNTDKNGNLNNVNYYLVIDIIDNFNELLVQDLCITSYYYSKQFDNLSIGKTYHVIIKTVMCPFGYHLSLYSDHFIDNMSYFNYLEKQKNYLLIPVKIDHPSLENNNNHIIARLAFQIKVPTKLGYYIKCDDKFFKSHLQIILIHGNNVINLIENQLIIVQTLDSMQYILIHLKSPYNYQEGSLDIEFITDNQKLSFENILHIPGYEVSDKYSPNKHGIIFKELIFSPELVHCSFYIKLRKEKQTTFLNQSLKKPEIQTSIEYFDLDEKVRLKLQLYYENNLIFEQFNYNSFFLHHLSFYGNLVPQPDIKNRASILSFERNIPYLLVLSLDLSESPSWLLRKDLSDNISWVIRVFSSDTLGFVKDTSKEDSEKLLKESWERIEIGRAEKARNARKRYHAEQKLSVGEILDEEEQRIIQGNRLRKSSMGNVEISKLNELKQSKIVKKEEKKKVESLPPIKNNELPVNKKMPNVEDHSSVYIKTFLRYCSKNRCYRMEKSTENKILMTKEIKMKFSQSINDEYDLMIKDRLSQIEKFNRKKENQILNIGTLNKERINLRKCQSSEKVEILMNRKIIQEKENDIREKDKKLIDIVNDIYDVNTSLIILKEFIEKNVKSEYMKEAIKTLSAKKNEIYKNELKKFSNKDKQIVSKMSEEIKFFGFKVSDEVHNKINEIINF